MVSLARQTLRHEWRRFLPAVLAIGFASLLLMMQAALVLGIFGSASVYITGSSADLWLGYPGTQSVDQGRPLDPNVSSLLRMLPQVRRVEPFTWFDGDWRGDRATGGVSVFVSGIDPDARGLMFSRVLSPAERAALAMPDAVIVDRSELDKLGTQVGQRALINGHAVRIVAAGHGLRALGGVNVLASLDTARRLQSDADHPDWPTYWVATLQDSQRADAVAADIGGRREFSRYAVWSAAQFARRSTIFWMFDTGAGAGVLFLAAVVFLAGAVISSQTLVAAVVGSAREYATLNALGVSMPALGMVVIEQALWVGVFGAIGAAGLSSALVAVARFEDVPVVLDAQVSAACIALVMLLAACSGVVALRGLRRADPAVLLR